MTVVGKDFIQPQLIAVFTALATSISNISYKRKVFSFEDEGCIFLNKHVTASFKRSHQIAVNLHHSTVVENDHVRFSGGFIQPCLFTIS